MAARGGLWATGQVAGCGLWDGQEVVSVQGERLRFGSLKEVVTRWAGPVGGACGPGQNTGSKFHQSLGEARML